jgi:hypothetical protein
MQDYFNKPVFVIGLPRSGTSMIAGTLGICGAWTGSTVPGGGTENPKGFFEHASIRELVIKKILKDLGCDPLGVRKLPPFDLQIEVIGLADIIKSIIEKDGYRHDKPWLLKDAKLTLLWPIFRKAFTDATWLVVRRDEEGFINSCLRTSFMKQHSQDRDFWKNYAEEYRIRIDALIGSGANVLEISSPDVVQGDFDQFREVVSRLGLTFRENELKEFISPDYWHGNAQTAGKLGT